MNAPVLVALPLLRDGARAKMPFAFGSSLACVWLATLLPATATSAAEIVVSTAAQIASALATVQPGDTLLMADGVWTNQRIQFAANGTAAQPITLRAQNPGQVVLNGNSKLNVSGNHLVVDGLRFEGGALAAGDAVVEFRGSKGEAINSRLTNSAIIDYNPADVDTRYFWVSLYGQNNRVDHNRFEGQDHSGVTVAVWRDSAGPDNHLIDANHFVDRPAPVNPSSTNGFETIRIGTSDESLSDSFTTVQNNLFERVDGEIEIISNKSGGNVYQYNTFRESAGTLTLRHGNNATVAGNFFLGENKDGSGGIRVIGEGHAVVNNYIASVDDRAGGAISLSAGVPSSPLNGYYQVRNALIAHNTVVDVGGPAVTFDDGLGGSGRSLLPENVTVANNLFRSNGPAVFEGAEGADWTWEGNLAFGGSLGPKAGAGGITVADPQLQLDGNGVWRLAAGSPAIDSAAGGYSSVVIDDFDGQPRIGLYDVGADELSMATIVRRPLTGNDVGPGWLTVGPPIGGGGGCFADGCAIQAEDFAYLRDPNNDGFTWTVLADPTALGGAALRAPLGDRIDLPAETHDALAVYEVSFQQEGVYRAYYRAAGDNGSSDSIYVPDDFNIDPDNSDSTSQDGSYRWELGGLFTIDSANVGMPLEFRIGKREQATRLDALVLHLNQALTASELDALFTVNYGEADFNRDGVVDGADLTVWQQNFGLVGSATMSQGDATGDGTVSGADLLLWQRQLSGSASVDAAATVPEPSSLAALAFGAAALLTIRCNAAGRRVQI
ncbi:MAG: PEP-CTERM sorting domain-containing protein [Planctomycetales bacterium]|nr:PEP-CTERM sorting domain-containing protein [Planctomycetales bacterium]